MRGQLLTPARQASRASEHRISVVDLPNIEHLRLTYDYP